MTREVRHTGTRSWWNGTWTSLCGLKFRGSDAERLWFPSLSGIPRCPVCKAIERGGR